MERALIILGVLAWLLPAAGLWRLAARCGQIDRVTRAAITVWPLPLAWTLLIVILSLMLEAMHSISGWALDRIEGEGHGG